MQSYSIPRIVNLIFAVVILSLLGCSNSEDTNLDKSIENTFTKANKTSQAKFTAVSSETSIEFYPCSNSSTQSMQEQTWCEAKKIFQQSPDANSASFDSYVFGYRLGINQARLARDRKFTIDTESNKNINLEVAENGFNTGYDTVAEAMGVIEYTANESLEEEDQNYQSLWNEAADFYQSSGFSNSNPFIKQSYISGFMAGSKIAVSQDASMASIMDPEATQDIASGPLFSNPKNISTQTLKAFEQGINTGHQAMLDQIRQSLEKFTKQMFENFGDGENAGDGQDANLGDMNDILEQLKQLDQQGSNQSNS
jgi:hypothetical protein